MEVAPDDVIEILARRLANEMIQNAVQEAALRKLEPPKPEETVGIPTAKESPRRTPTAKEPPKQ